MLGLHTRGTRRKVSCQVWIGMLAVLAATQAARGTREPLFPSSEICSTEAGSELHCTVTNDKLYQLEGFEWGDKVNKVIIKNATDLLLKDPSCSDKGPKKVAVYNSDKVTTQSGGSNCSQQLYLYNCRNVKAIGGVDLVYMNNSEAKEISLKRVSQLDLESSSVREVSVYVDGKQSIIQNSRIEVVKKLEMEGDFVYRVEHSELGKIEGFISNTKKPSTFENVTVKEVAAKGFVILGGKVTMTNSVFEHTEPEGLVVESTLIIENCEFHSLSYNSIQLREKASVHFKNVTIANEKEVNFHISEATTELSPLAVLRQFQSSLSSGWVMLYLSIGFGAGILAGALLTYYMLQRRGLATAEVDMTELLMKERSPIPTPESKEPKAPNNNNNSSSSNPTAAVPTRPLPTIPQDDEMYEQYSDVAGPQPTSEVTRAPMPVPDESSSSAGSAFPKSGPKLPKGKIFSKPQISTASTVAESHDERDNLPPPPLPEDDEELYEDLAPVCTNPRPRPVPPANKPMKKGPPPLAPQRKH